MELSDAVNAQLKAEIDGAELNKNARFVLQQKYGLVPYALTDVEIDWLTNLDEQEARYAR